MRNHAARAKKLEEELRQIARTVHVYEGAIHSRSVEQSLDELWILCDRLRSVCKEAEAMRDDLERRKAQRPKSP